MNDKRVIRSTALEDQTSPRSARYIICLRRLTDGYVVETTWGGKHDRKHHESYFRPTLSAAQEKFDKVLASKAGKRRIGRRCYLPVENAEQLVLNGVI